LEINRSKILRITTAALIVLLLLLAGEWFYATYTVEKTLLKDLSKIDYVENVNITRERGETVVSVRLKNVEDIKETYNKLYNELSTRLRNQPFSIHITNKPDHIIREIYNNEIQFILYEALQTGKYKQMVLDLNKIELENNVDIKTFLDSKYLYLQINHNEYDYYEIIQKPKTN